MGMRVTPRIIGIEKGSRSAWLDVGYSGTSAGRIGIAQASAVQRQGRGTKSPRRSVGFLPVGYAFEFDSLPLT